MPGARKKPEKRQLFAVPKAPGKDGTAIVGVGASAGGLEAFTALLQGLPPDPGVAIVFVQHLAPQHESALVPLLTGQSSLPVVQVAQAMEVEPNRIYVIPPNAQMVISGTTLRLSARPEGRKQYTPIDTFFSSLAEAAGPRAIGVILSGTASDGALGMREIKSAGGVTIAQSPETAKYDGMPRAAIETGMVDLVLAPREIAVKLSELPHQASMPAPDHAVHADLPVSDGELREVFEILRPVSGVDFRHYKLPTIKRRLFRRLALHRLSDVAQYVQLLREDQGEVRSLYQDLLIHVTRFFREPESFEAMAKEVFPAIVEGRGPDRPIRAWVSGCATGEEAYSLAIALVEYLQANRIDAPVQIFATDVSEAAVDQARSGVFATSIEADVSPERLRKFFTRNDGSYRVTKMIRDLCVFARQDLTKDPPFSRLDLILCRNVLIYMDAVLQRRLLSVFHYALNATGFLVLGQAETVGAQIPLFSLIDKKYRVHRKRVAPGAAFTHLPVGYSGSLTARKPQADPASAEKLLQTEIARLLMDRFVPPSVVVDSEMQVVQFRGQTSAYLEPAAGEASLSLLTMAKEGLLYGLRTAFNAARRTRQTVRKTGLQVRSDKGWKPVSIEVVPLSTKGQMHYLVLFDEGPQKARAKTPPPSKPAKARTSDPELLQRELAASREYLQSVIQELEAANEELQSANEEILSSNEELQSTNEELDTAKEELQSTNEELNTVNEELHGRNEELSRVNSDLVNLLGSVQIAIVIVSADLRIRRFTPMAEKVLNLIPADIDRPIGHINPNLVGTNLEQLIAECIDSISPIEREIRDRQDHWYSLRIRPYRSVENKIEGAVVTLFDLDAPKRYEESLRAATLLAEEMLEASSKAIALIDAGLQIRAASRRFSELFSMTDEERRRRPLLTDFARADGVSDQLRDLARADGNSTVKTTLTLVPARLGNPIVVEVRAFPPFDDSPNRVLLLMVNEAAAPADRS